MKTFLSWLLGISIAIFIIWIAAINGLFLTSFFSPKYEQVRRETYEQSKAYNQGMAQEVMKFQQDYITANDSQKDALASVIIHRTADYDLSKLPPNSKVFIEKLRRGER